MSQKITTSLLNRKVAFTEMVDDNVHYPDVNSGDVGWIRTVYLDSDGNPQYTIELEENGQLVETYNHAFCLVKE